MKACPKTFMHDLQSRKKERMEEQKRKEQVLKNKIKINTSKIK